MPATISQSDGSTPNETEKNVGQLEEREEQVEYVSPSDRQASKAKEEVERRLVRKLDRQIMPLLCVMYLFSYLDRSNIGNARLQGLPEDILHGDPTGVQFDWVTSAFFFPYILCQVPATLLSKLCPPRIWLGCVAIGWGLCSVLMSTAYNFAGIVVARVGLGVFEAAFSPGFPLYFCLFYTREEMGLRTASWFGFAAIAGAFGGLIAFGIQHVHSAIANWRLLFLIEGVPTVLLGVCAMFVLPNRPEKTTLFTEEEREVAMERANRGSRADVGRVLRKKHIIFAFKDWKIYCAAVMFIGANTATGGITAFLPTIIKTFGFTNAIAQLLTVPPYAVAALVLCATSYVSDRIQSRGIFVALACVLGGVGYILLLVVTSNNHVRYFATFCITTGAYCTIGIILSWFSHNLGSETKRAAGMPLYMSLGQVGSVLGSHLFPLTDGPRYIKGFGVTCALQFFGAIIALVLTLHFRRENGRRDRLHGRPTPNATVDTSDYADEAPDFRYTP